MHRANALGERNWGVLRNEMAQGGAYSPEICAFPLGKPKSTPQLSKLKHLSS